MCWCKYGNEGAFCEFTEGMRCCAEDHCNYHGLIEFVYTFLISAKKIFFKLYRCICKEKRKI